MHSIAILSTLFAATSAQTLTFPISKDAVHYGLFRKVFHIDDARAALPETLSIPIAYSELGRHCFFDLYAEPYKEGEMTFIGEVYCSFAEDTLYTENQKCAQLVNWIQNKEAVLNNDVQTTIAVLRGSNIDPRCPSGMRMSLLTVI
jgi:hypothetical protein